MTAREREDLAVIKEAVKRIDKSLESLHKRFDAQDEKYDERYITRREGRVVHFIYGIAISAVALWISARDKIGQ